MVPGEHGGGPGEEFFTAGSSSFTGFPATHRPGLLGTRRLLPDGVRAEGIPHGTTVLALTYGDGVLIAGDRRATMGNLIAQRDLEKVHPADDHTAVAFAGSVGLALDLVKLYQIELSHFGKIQGIHMTLAAKATRLATMIRGNLGQAMRGLAVVPLLAGYDPAAPQDGRGRIFGFDVAGGRYEKSGFHAEGSGSPYAGAR
jgi:proteasome beta subunit